MNRSRKYYWGLGEMAVLCGFTAKTAESVIVLFVFPQLMRPIGKLQFSHSGLCSKENKMRRYVQSHITHEEVNRMQHLTFSSFNWGGGVTDCDWQLITHVDFFHDLSHALWRCYGRVLCVLTSPVLLF